MAAKQRKLIDPVEIGAKGGAARAANLTEQQREDSARSAVEARWAKYYRENPEKLKARQEREARRKKASKPR